MTTLTLTAIFVGCGVLLACVVFSRMLRPHSGDRPSINIDFDSAKEREDKNRYFS